MLMTVQGKGKPKPSVLMATLSNASFNVNVCQKPLQYCKVISLQLIKKKINLKTNKKHASFECASTQSIHWGEADTSLWALPARVLLFLAETRPCAAAAAKELDCRSPLWFCLPRGLSAAAPSATSASSQKAGWERHLPLADQASNISEIQKPLSLSGQACFQVRHCMSCLRPVS